MEALSKVKDLNIWYDRNTPPIDGSDLTPGELAAAKELSELGIDLLKLRDHYKGIMRRK